MLIKVVLGDYNMGDYVVGVGLGWVGVNSNIM